MNLNTGTEWSEWAIADLKRSMELKEAIEEIADFQCRDVEEVRRKVAEIDPPHRMQKVLHRFHW